MNTVASCLDSAPAARGAAPGPRLASCLAALLALVVTGTLLTAVDRGFPALPGAAGAPAAVAPLDAGRWPRYGA